MPCCTGTSIGACNSTVQIGQLLYDLPLIGKVLAYATAAADQLKYRSGTNRMTRTSFLSAGSIGSEFVIVSLGQTCMIDRCFDSRMQLNVQLISEGPSRNSTILSRAQADYRWIGRSRSSLQHAASPPHHAACMQHRARHQAVPVASQWM